MPLGHKKQRKNETEMEHPQKRHLQKSAAQAEIACAALRVLGERLEAGGDQEVAGEIHHFLCPRLRRLRLLGVLRRTVCRSIRPVGVGRQAVSGGGGCAVRRGIPGLSLIHI